MGLRLFRALRPGLARRRARIVVIGEFGPDVERLLEMLGRAGYRPRMGHPGEALEVVEAGDYDVVVSDLMLPCVGGLEILRVVRAPWTRVILLTGDPDGMLAEAARGLGAFAVLDKRSMDELARCVDQAVDQALDAREVTLALGLPSLSVPETLEVGEGR